MSDVGPILITGCSWAKADVVARTIERALTAQRPLSRYLIARRLRFALATRMPCRAALGTR